ncbi:hypothetical protein CKAH01_16551 [Colletotrichum kahawae]|uniref:Uncharacterized protein n=1 Tax=Colletotrichum kahawae TaxID=34407 RepID=A0AAD9YG97_COLKA|nr:hypothetical protein CKAH01_16551 [Colletotrichum kahawae]
MSILWLDPVQVVVRSQRTLPGKATPSSSLKLAMTKQTTSTHTWSTTTHRLSTIP